MKIKKKEIIMLKKYWKKIGLLILIIACVFNVMSKLVNKLSLDKEMLSSAQYMYEQQQNENKTKQVLKNKIKYVIIKHSHIILTLRKR